MGLVLELRTIPLFKALGAESLVPVAAIASHVSYDAEATVFSQGDEGDRLYVVSEGCVEIVKDAQRLAALAPGQSFGEMALIESAPRSATARCSEASKLLTIAREDFDDLLNVYPSIARAVAEVLAVRLRDAFGAR
jgi:CRP/FNR family transcriptional regulator, cyclic AMP receptor protein